MIRYLPICEKSLTVKGDIEKRKKIEKRVKVVEKVDKDKQKISIEEKFNNKVELNRKKVKKIVPQRFHKQFKVFEKTKLKRMPVKKPWDHVINLRENFVKKKKEYI